MDAGLGQGGRDFANSVQGAPKPCPQADGTRGLRRLPDGPEQLLLLIGCQAVVFADPTGKHGGGDAMFEEEFGVGHIGCHVQLTR